MFGKFRKFANEFRRKGEMKMAPIRPPLTPPTQEGK